MNELSKRIASLSPEKQALLKLQLEKKDLIASKRKYRITRRISGQRIPLTYSQERLWFLEALEPGNPANNRLTTLSIRGNLNISAMQNSISNIINRHEILRTSYRQHDNRLFQCIREKIDINFSVIDRQPLPEKEWKEETQNLAREEVRKPFDIVQGPIIRAKLIRFSARKHILLLCMHHISVDAWSIQQFHHELSILYECFCSNESSPLVALPIQYADYAFWQRQNLTEEKLVSQLSYWKKQLDNLSLLQLPTDRPRPSLQSFSGASISLWISGSTTRALKSLAQSESVTLFMTLLAVFQILLHRYTQQDDIVVGVPIAGRTQAETEQLIGFFVNSLVLRVDLSGNPDFRTFLNQVRNISLEAYANQSTPFEKVVEELQPSRDLSRNPLFQVMFNFENIPKKISAFHSLEVEELDIDSAIAPLDLTVEVIEKGDGLLCLFNYNTALFNASTIERMSTHFEVLLNAIVAAPEQTISSYSMLTEQEEHQLLVDWNDTKTDYPGNQCVHELFEAQVERTPDAIAVVFEDSELTYGELNTRSNQLAHYLASMGVGPDKLVGICVERSLEMMVGLLAILKSGGAYVSLDPVYPKERLSFILADGHVEVLITQQSLIEDLPEEKAKTICIDSQWPEIASASDGGNLCSDLMQTNLAYVIYTSGSTGKPKGVMIEHRSAVNLLYTLKRRPGLDASDVLLAVSTISFDIHLLELFLPLTVGARIIIASRDIAMDGRRLYQLLIKCGATIMQATPVTWHMLLLSGWNERIPLKVLCTGEAFPHELVNELLPRCSSLWNLYGPTEVTVYS